MRRVAFHVFILAFVIAYASCQVANPEACLELPDGSKIPSISLCNQFYVCDGGMLSEEGTCPSNMLFDSDNGVCDFAENVDCKGVPSPGFEPTDPPADTTLSPDTTAAPTSSPAQSCPPEDPAEPVFLPVKNDCSSYILCYHGREIVQSCPPNLYWNNASYECDSVSVANCKV